MKQNKAVVALVLFVIMAVISAIAVWGYQASSCIALFILTYPAACVMIIIMALASLIGICLLTRTW